MKSKFLFPSLFAVFLTLAIDGTSAAKPNFNDVWSVGDFYQNELFVNELPRQEEKLVKSNFGGSGKAYAEEEMPVTQGYPQIEPVQLGRQAVTVAASQVAFVLPAVTINSVRTRRTTKYPVGTNCKNPPVTLAPGDNTDAPSGKR